MIGQPVFAQHLFEGARLVVAPVEDGEIAIAGAMGELVVQDLGDDAFGLLVGIAAGDDLEPAAVAQFAP